MSIMDAILDTHAEYQKKYLDPATRLVLSVEDAAEFLRDCPLFLDTDTVASVHLSRFDGLTVLVNERALTSFVCNQQGFDDPIGDHVEYLKQGAPKHDIYARAAKDLAASCMSAIDSADKVNHPPHYTAHPSGVECIQITEHMNFCLGNAIKYIWRADLKNGVEDLKKAKWYIEREIERREREKPDPT